MISPNKTAAVPESLTEIDKTILKKFSRFNHLVFVAVLVVKSSCPKLATRTTTWSLEIDFFF